MSASLEIAWKDLRQRVRDRSAIMLAIVVPLGLAAIFSMIFGPASTPSPFEYALVDEDRSTISRSFGEELLASLEQDGIATVAVTDEAEARAAVRDGDLDAAFIIPAGFADRVESDGPARLDVVGSVDSATATEVARSVAASYVAGLDAARVAVAGVAHGSGGELPPDQLQEVAHQTVATAAPVTIEDTSAEAHVLDVKTYFAAGMAVFFLLFTVQFGVSSLIEERTEGTLSRLLAAPVRRTSILVGKLLTSVALGIVSLTVLVLATSLLLGATWGNPVGVGLLVVSGVLAATGITSVVASLAKTAEQAGSWQAVVAVTLGLLGGAFFPIQQSGSLMATVSLVTPHAWFMRGLGSLAGGGEVLAVLPAVGALLLIAAVTGAVASRRIGRIVAP
ncbi:MAG TPA: ABC transporter permease [Nocardioidaceae bacterium]|nr:ABC transporter permease [Nocardioidaceae bacterium]